MTETTFDIEKWLITAEVRETPAPGTEPAQPGEYDDDGDDTDSDDDEGEEESS